MRGAREALHYAHEGRRRRRASVGLGRWAVGSFVPPSRMRPSGRRTDERLPHILPSPLCIACLLLLLLLLRASHSPSRGLWTVVATLLQRVSALRPHLHNTTSKHFSRRLKGKSSVSWPLDAPGNDDEEGKLQELPQLRWLKFEVRVGPSGPLMPRRRYIPCESRIAGVHSGACSEQSERAIAACLTLSVRQ